MELLLHTPPMNTSKNKRQKRANKVKAIDNAGNIAGESNLVDILNNYWSELSSFFITYEPWQYKFRLNKILIEINNIVTDGKYMIRNSPKDFAEISQRLEACIVPFEDCERNYKRRFFYMLKQTRQFKSFFCCLLH